MTTETLTAASAVRPTAIPPTVIDECLRIMMGLPIDSDIKPRSPEMRRTMQQVIEHALKSVGTPAPETHMATRLVIVESPFAGDVEANIAYARAALRDCLDRGEAPYASHLLYTQPGVLDDNDADQRRHGIEAGLAWGKMATATVVYTDRGISTGMQQGIDRAKAEGRAVEYRSISEAKV